MLFRSSFSLTETRIVEQLTEACAPVTAFDLSLIHIFSAACGMAMAAKLSQKDYRVYTILGDGEIEEGMVWEAAMFAGHYHLDNLTAVVDYNGLQIDGKLSEVCSPEPIPEKFAACGWNVVVKMCIRDRNNGCLLPNGRGCGLCSFGAFSHRQDSCFSRITARG